MSASVSGSSYSRSQSKYKQKARPAKEGHRIAAADDFGVLDLGWRPSLDQEITIPKGHGWATLTAHVVSEAIHTSETVVKQGACLGGTRKAFLQRLEDKIGMTSSDAPNVVWLNGPGGYGKTAVMNTLARTLSKSGTLLASFFFFRADGRRNTTQTLIPTLAYQISQRSALAKQYMEAMVEEDPSIFGQPSGLQAHALLVRPLVHAFEVKPQEWPLNAPLTVLVDGLNECVDVENQAAMIDTLFDVVFQIWTHTKIRLRLLISSRPDGHLQERFRAKEKEGLASLVYLDDSPDGRLDIQRYVDAQLEAIRQRWHPFAARLQIDASWPSPEERKLFLDLTAGQFAFARTALGFAADPGGNPRERLVAILRNCVIPLDQSNPSIPLDQLHALILSLIPKAILPQALRIIGAMLIEGGIPPSPLFLEFFLRLPLGFLDQVFAPLKSLFSFGDRSMDIWVYHSTLGDFLFDQRRSGPFGLFVDRKVVYADIAKSAIATCRAKQPPSLEVMDTLLDYLSTLESTLMRAKVEGKILREALDNVQPSELPPWAVSLLSIIQTQLSSYLRSQRSLTGSFRLSYKVNWYLPGALGKDVQRRTSLYEKSPSGRFCLVLMFGTGRESVPFAANGGTFGQALLRRALSGEARLLQSDQSVGWNMYDPMLTYRVFDYWRSSENEFNPFLGLVNAIGKFHPDAMHFVLRDDWPAENIELLGRWHYEGHPPSANPWLPQADADKHPSGSTSIQTTRTTRKLNNATCLQCAHVVDNCRAELIKAWLEDRTWGPDFKILESLYAIVTRNAVLGNDIGVVTQVLALSKNVESGKQAPRLASIRSDVEARLDNLWREWEAKYPETDEGDAAGRRQYNEHCIPRHD